MRCEIYMEVNYKSLDFSYVTSCSLTGKCQASIFRAAKGDTVSQLKQETSNAPGARGGVVVKALRYKPARRGFDSRWCHWNFSVI
jgi:hypothetical protein